MIRTLSVTLLVATLSTSSACVAQRAAPLTAEQRATVIDSLASALNARYVFPEVAARMDSDLHARATRGEFDKSTDPSSFAQLLTTDLQALSHDRHLRVRFGSPPRPAGPANPSDGASGMFGRTDWLEDDVAYVDIRSFGFPAESVREDASRVMSEVADAKALIIDLRSNGGGDPFTVALVASYLFGDKPVHLNSLYFRPANRTDDFYTNPNVDGKKFGPDKPVFVLTSARTFSGAEEFAYDLQTQKRATIVGETTGGGANPGGPVRLPYDLTVFVPTGRAINPVTRTNWEGVGVKPDVTAAGDDALDVALGMARKAVSRRQ
ncbi:MAG TPA: S41 family peptidase [Gemmatimonadaceae bacterium]|jgi:hypothetical protein|nr:S41 family peptidase [Gemmatimonadaceae bacterium]